MSFLPEGLYKAKLPGAASASSQWRRINGARIKSALVNTYHDFDRHDYLTCAAALAYYSLLSLFPLLVFVANLLAILPIPNLFEQSLAIMGRIVPSEAMALVRGVLREALDTNPGLLSFSILGTLFAASGGFSALITALNVAYDVRVQRPFWKRQLVAFGLTLLVGLMVTIVLVSMAVGPKFGIWVAARFRVSWLFAAFWPYLRWILIGICTIFSVETIYFLAPNIRQRFKDQIPGAIVAVLTWIGASWALGWYLSHIANYNRTFGTLGAVVGLMLWFYVTALSLITGAEMNAELRRARLSLVPRVKST